MLGGLVTGDRGEYCGTYGLDKLLVEVVEAGGIVNNPGSTRVVGVEREML
jgi:hypothetical protein